MTPKKKDNPYSNKPNSELVELVKWSEEQSRLSAHMVPRLVQVYDLLEQYEKAQQELVSEVLTLADDHTRLVKTNDELGNLLERTKKITLVGIALGALGSALGTIAIIVVLL